MTFLKQDTIFVCVNTALPLCKQFFAAAHELYHIYCYVENADQSYIKNGSMLDSATGDETGRTQEDLEANAFAGLLLMPDQLLHEQILLYRYNADAPIWLREKIGAQKIKSYTDQEILESLSLVRGPLACATYTQMLKLACDAFSKDYFSEHYRALEEADYAAISREDYMNWMKRSAL